MTSQVDLVRQDMAGRDIPAGCFDRVEQMLTSTLP